jgi:hypothetical protein
MSPVNPFVLNDKTITSTFLDNLRIEGWPTKQHRPTRALDRRVIGGKFAESVVGTSTVNGGGPTLHQDADADRFGRLLFGCSGENSPSRVCGDATVAPNRHPDGHAYQLFDFPLEGPGRQCRGAHRPVSAVYLWNHLSQSTALRIEVVKYFVVMVVFAHVSKQRVPRINNCWHAKDSSQQEASMAVILASAVVVMVWCRDRLRGLTPGSHAVSHQAQLIASERAGCAWYDSVGSNDSINDASDSGADGGSFTLIQRRQHTDRAARQLRSPLSRSRLAE